MGETIERGRWGIETVDWQDVPRYRNLLDRDPEMEDGWGAAAELLSDGDVRDLAHVAAAAAGLLVLDPAALRAALNDVADQGTDISLRYEIDAIMARLTAPEQPR